MCVFFRYGSEKDAVEATELAQRVSTAFHQEFINKNKKAIDGDGGGGGGIFYLKNKFYARHSFERAFHRT